MLHGSTNYEIFNAFMRTFVGIVDKQHRARLEHGIRTGLLARDFLKSQGDPKADHMFFVGILHVIGEDISQGKPDAPKDIVVDEHGQRHTQFCAEIVGSIPSLETVSRAVEDYRENLDGSGFPLKKKGTQISYYAQVLKLADALELSYSYHTKLTPLQVNNAFLNQMHHKVEVKLDLSFLRVFDEKYIKVWRSTDVMEQFSTCLEEIKIPELATVGIDAFGKLSSALGKIIDFQCGYSFGHSERVMSFSLRLGREMALGHDEMSELKWAALMHDSGKLLMPNSLLSKIDDLSNEEQLLIRQLPEKGVEVLSPLSGISDFSDVMHSHKEQVDGHGYPDGLKARKIPVLSRIINVADAFDAMTHKRPYGTFLDSATALETIKKGAGAIFDADVAAALEKVLDESAA